MRIQPIFQRYLLSVALGFLFATVTSQAYAGLGSLGESVYLVEQKEKLSCPLVLVAGNAMWNYSGDGGPATEAAFFSIWDLVLDKDGNLYISTIKGGASTGGGIIRKVDTSGIVDTFAGTGQSGSSGDGGPAIDASFNEIRGMAFSKEGDLYLGLHNSGIRKIGPNGIVSTVIDKAPMSTSGYFITDVALDPNGQLHIATINSGYRGFVWRIEGDGTPTLVAGKMDSPPSALGDDGPAVEALVNPYKIAFDKEGNLYIAEKQTPTSPIPNFRVRKVGKDGIITTVAGTGTFGSSGDGGPAKLAQIRHVSGIAVDQEGRIFISEEASSPAPADYGKIRVIDNGQISTQISTLIDGSDGSLNPKALALDNEGNLYVAGNDSDYMGQRVWKCPLEEEVKIQKPVLKKVKGFVHPSQPPEKRTPPGILERKAGVKKPSVLQKIKSFFNFK